MTSLYSATTRDEELQTLVQETLKFQISSDPMHVDLSKRSLCRFHALHYKLYVHRFNIDTMIAIKTFDHEDMVLDDATMEQVLSNLPSVEKAWEKSYGQWVRDLQTHVLDLFAENVEKSFLCLKADLHQKLFAKEKQLEKRISQIQEEQDLALDEAEGRLQIQMQSEKFKRAKHQLDDYGIPIVVFAIAFAVQSSRREAPGGAGAVVPVLAPVPVAMQIAEAPFPFRTMIHKNQDACTVTRLVLGSPTCSS